ncbi:ABC transporter permease [Metallumcola ferriviriculae]|uniref:ABC transporter permease n=1 Tax=Metallumcola ferriviriculae TaxID=3039180 RepID=A0AAU0UP34_9FIRM|nr:ABC transporter permease [Desulfitibacteraceae bacterium MK1]
MSQHKVRWWQYVLSLAGLLTVWQIAAMLVDSPVFPEPINAIIAFALEFRGEMIHHFVVSTYRVVISLFLAMLAAIPLGLLLGRNPKIDRFVAPAVYMVYPIPKIVFFPLIMILLGIGNVSKIFIITLIVSFQILVSTRDAAKGVPQASVYSARSLGAKGWQVYRHVIVPACLPEMITALRISLGTAVAVLFLAETVAGSSGLGYFILSAMYRAEYSAMFAGIMAMGLLGLMLYYFVDLFEKMFCSWQHL